jgi:hypothetical protein
MPSRETEQSPLAYITASPYLQHSYEGKQQMPDTLKKLEISQSELDLIANALETQTKILHMQASAGGHGALTRLNEVKSVLATVSSQRDKKSHRRTEPSGFWGLLRSMGQAT